MNTNNDPFEALEAPFESLAGGGISGILSSSSSGGQEPVCGPWKRIREISRIQRGKIGEGVERISPWVKSGGPISNPGRNPLVVVAQEWTATFEKWELWGFIALVLYQQKCVYPDGHSEIGSDVRSDEISYKLAVGTYTGRTTTKCSYPIFWGPGGACTPPNPL
jgi:hypothetical protein